MPRYNTNLSFLLTEVDSIDRSEKQSTADLKQLSTCSSANNRQSNCLKSDILVITAPRGPETDKLVDWKVIEVLGPEGTLINVSRGSVVEEPAMIEALQNGNLGPAGVYFYWYEPTPDPALTQLSNVTLQPHHSSGTVETRNAMVQLVVDNLAAYFAGEPLLKPICQLDGDLGWQ